MYISEVVKNLKPALFISSPGHHQWFLHDEECRAIILESAEFIRREGVDRYLRREYPHPENKQIIINRIDDQYYVVDGNKHLLALITACPDLTVGQLTDYHPDLVRLWKNGYESREQHMPFDVYIPVSIDTTNLSRADIGTDFFKNPPASTKIIPADVPFDSRLFTAGDRGRHLYETALSLLGYWLTSAA